MVARASETLQDAVTSGINLRCVRVRGLAPGRLLRGGGPSFTAARTVAELVEERGLRTVLDLRSSPEIARDGAAEEFAKAGVAVHNTPITGYDSTPINTARPAPEDFVPYYLGMLEAEGWADVFASMAAASEAPFLLMCACGKDRTGVTTALLLSYLGVDDDEVAADFALTRVLLPRDLDLFADKWLRRGHTRADWVVRTDTRELTVHAFLSELRRRHGSVREALVHAGVRSEDLDVLRARLVAE